MLLTKVSIYTCIPKQNNKNIRPNKYLYEFSVQDFQNTFIKLKVCYVLDCLI